MASHEELISQFTDVTGVEAERAQFYLESSAWHLDVALASFFETDEQGASTSILAEERMLDSSTDESTGSEAQLKSINPVGSISKSKPRIATIKDLQKKDSSSDEEEGQAFYAGGSETSGQQILGPGKKKDLITEMFKSCQEQSLSLENETAVEPRPSTFSGIGYKLGQTSNDAEAFPSIPNKDHGRDSVKVISADMTTYKVLSLTHSSAKDSIKKGLSSGQQANSGIITLKLWRNGFTINDGELRTYDDSKNKEFLSAIKRGEVPIEIQQEIQGAEIRMDMEDHRSEEYIPSKVRLSAFSGKGHILGSPSPATVGMPVSTGSSDDAANELRARSQLIVDTNKPATTIQIRLADGSNVRAQFNLFHTVGDLRRFIITMRPQYASTNFSLLTAYPSTELNEENSTISQANLQNSTVIQRLK
ncbi:NSFL1 cofactor p47-like isoform X2 [Belonocnema kinseyi]|uniref:NSFL1 cofactor p47-like isoform X2 n=1 Tax=Belonocnema kinseyi TaxID=2817044 RepID=UPI00143CE5A0|nr:NSFL1 cofactor p47-like isoform X2 [Belonocnema kinseyi]